MTRILVTGGAGFIGSALCNRMADEGHEVSIFDNCSRGTGGLVDPKRFDICEPTRADITKTLDGCTDLSAFVGGHAYNSEALFHLAAINGTQNFYDRPADVLDVQIRGTQNAIDACLAHDIKTLVLFSSSEVYQSPPVIPTPEDVPLSIPDVTNPRYSYAIGKIASEAMAWHSAIERVIVIRPHQVYGPNAGYQHVIPQFILRAARTPDGGTFDILGASVRSFIYIDDFVSACVAIAKRHENDETCREIYHVGTEEMVSTVALAGYVADIMGRKTGGRYAYGFKTKPGPKGGTVERCPDTRKLRALGWSAKVPLREGLERTVKAYLKCESTWPSEQSS